MYSSEAAHQLGSAGADTPVVKSVTTNNNDITAVGGVEMGEGPSRGEIHQANHFVTAVLRIANISENGREFKFE